MVISILFSTFAPRNRKTKFNDLRSPAIRIMKKKSDVYVVSWNQVWDSNEISNSNKVFASKEGAFKFYEDFKKNEMESIKKKGVGDDWVESDGNWESKENGNASWEYYKDYEYTDYHSCIYIDKREIL